MITLLKFILKYLARATVNKYQPLVVGITGSIGKTSVRQAVSQVVSKKYRVNFSSKNLNNEIGLPLSVMNIADSGYSSPLAWLVILGRALAQLIIKKNNYPQVLVLEYGVDHPGDMDYLLSIVKPRVGVLTAATASHLLFMGSEEGVLKEKAKLLAALPIDGTAVLNAEDSRVLSLKNSLACRVMTYGFKDGCVVRADNLTLAVQPSWGINFKLSLEGNSLPILITGTVGEPAVLSYLAAVCVGLSLDLSPLTIVDNLKNFPLPLGRLRLLPGIKGTILLDDTYNSSPAAAVAALDALVRLPLSVNGRRWAILGDMLELGQASEFWHGKVGEKVAAVGINYLVTVGSETRALTRAAVAKGFNPDQAWHFPTSREAGLFVQDRLQAGDVVLIKGSQGMRCEKITKELMAEPGRAQELLVRQSKKWLNS